MIRTGIGYDKHPLVSGRKLLIGGVEFLSDKGEAGHSDGDVLLHAICDCLLGASGLGDIGELFPPTDCKYKNANSLVLLETVWNIVQKSGWKLINLDCVLLLETPKFLPKRQEVRENIAKVLDCDISCIFVKAKTGEKLGDIGKMLAIEAFATCLLEK